MRGSLRVDPRRRTRGRSVRGVTEVPSTERPAAEIPSAEPSSRCAFCAIVRGDTAAHEVARLDGCTAFLDRRPLFHGHTLVVPDAHHETLVDLPIACIEPLFSLARAVAAVMPAALGAAGTFVAMNNIVSQSVPHLHVHVVPRRPKDGLRGFFWPRTTYVDDEHAASVAAVLAAALADRQQTARDAG